MKQTKKLTRSQREYLEREHGVDVRALNARLVEETSSYIKIQCYPSMEIKTYEKE